MISTNDGGHLISGENVAYYVDTYDAIAGCFTFLSFTNHYYKFEGLGAIAKSATEVGIGTMLQVSTRCRLLLELL